MEPACCRNHTASAAEAARVQPQQAHHAAAHHAAVDGALHRALRQQRGGAVEARMRPFLRVDDAVEQAGRVARPLRRRRIRAVDDGAAPAQFGQCPGGGTAGQAGADDQRAALTPGSRCRAAPPRLESRLVHGAQFGAGRLLHLEAGAGQGGSQRLQRSHCTHLCHRGGQARQALGQT
jgi:hypothetical protein